MQSWGYYLARGASTGYSNPEVSPNKNDGNCACACDENYPDGNDDEESSFINNKAFARLEDVLMNLGLTPFSRKMAIEYIKVALNLAFASEKVIHK